MHSAPEPVYRNPDRSEDNPQRKPRWWYGPPDDWTPEELAAQKAARKMVVEVQRRAKFRGMLDRGLSRTRRPSPTELDVLNQVIMWMVMPGMSWRWWMWKTHEEWKDELNRSHPSIVKARNRLHDRGLIRYQHGPLYRTFFCLDWVVLAEMLGLIDDAHEFRMEHAQHPETEARLEGQDEAGVSTWAETGVSGSKHLDNHFSPYRGGAGLAPLAPTPPTEEGNPEQVVSTSTPPRSSRVECGSAGEGGESDEPPPRREGELGMSRWIAEARAELGPRPCGPEEGEAHKERPGANEYVAYLARNLGGTFPTFRRGHKARYGREFAAEIEGGAAPEVLYRSADRIIERWPYHKLAVEDAMRDVMKADGLGAGPAQLEPARKKRSPEEEAEEERLNREAYEAFANAVEEEGGWSPPEQYYGV